MRGTLLIGLLSSVLLGCHHNPPARSIEVDSRLTVLCQELPQAPISNWEDILVAKSYETQMYYECANKHQGLVQAIEKFNGERP